MQVYFFTWTRKVKQLHVQFCLINLLAKQRASYICYIQNCTPKRVAIEISANYVLGKKIKYSLRLR